MQIITNLSLQNSALKLRCKLLMQKVNSGIDKWEMQRRQLYQFRPLRQSVHLNSSSQMCVNEASWCLSSVILNTDCKCKGRQQTPRDRGWTVDKSLYYGFINSCSFCKILHLPILAVALLGLTTTDT